MSAHPPETQKKHVAVIGAGMCGLKAIKEMLEAGMDVTAFEVSDDIGGIWRFTEEETLSTVYRSTRINTVRAANSFGDFPIPEGFPIAMGHEDMMRYFNLYADKFGLRKCIEFNTRVTHVEPVEARDEKSNWSWRVETEDAEGGGSRKTGTFDGVVVCSGHHSIPHSINFKGIDEFPGLVMHSHGYKDNRKFEGKRCVVVGIGNSGSDITTEISKVATRTVLVARRGAWIVPNPFFNEDADVTSRLDENIIGRLPQEVSASLVEAQLEPARQMLDKVGLGPTYRFNESHPTLTLNSLENNFYKQVEEGKIEGRRGIERFEGSTVHFTDGTSMEADAVVFCTGYKITFPFIPSDILEVNESNELKLYKHMVPVGARDVDNIAFIGVAQPVGAMAMIADVQARVAARYLSGALKMPSREAMKQDIAAKLDFNNKWYYKAPRHTVQVSIRPYLDELAEMIGATPHFLRLLFKAPWLLWLVYTTPTVGAHYRLLGYGADLDLARHDILKEYKNCYAHKRNRKTLLGVLVYQLKMLGIVLPMAIFYQLKSLLTTGKTFFFAW
ncbi:Dimethylaniline monooxygenase N-oxide-forming 2 [Hondaea fermentalgiana]|uniref:Flavin-containing monooxygenase 1 n=1 Tax=Hondaea fermentalgiana TaxID=2315210 RepID=A0A2R5GC53_9STRA|nr:Dimethylaniline monooxygenase N-oxide-forming 2 [Hondaea fermentalgiana]|eukprot:GBG25731.1 Dimethylaniline monooxygenase N-oxide-forming 2 [Hondaea fermentalgiana]